MCIDPTRQYSALINTTKGKITVTLHAAEAPRTVNNFVVLAGNGYYNGLEFWRIQDWVVQTGDPTDSGRFSPGYSLPEEAGKSGWAPGAIGYARSGAAVNGSQFFITKLALAGRRSDRRLQPLRRYHSRLRRGRAADLNRPDPEHLGQGRVTASEELFRRARQVMPGGVSSPVRAFAAVGGQPRFMVRAAGAEIEDADGNRYLDMVMSFGPHILGHNHPAVVAALREQLECGTSYGAPSIPELDLAEAICRLVPAVDRIRLVNSGTEAVMSALRLARAATRLMMRKRFGRMHRHHLDRRRHRQSGPGQLHRLEGRTDRHDQDAGRGIRQAQRHRQLHCARLHQDADDGRAERKAAGNDSFESSGRAAWNA